MEENLTKGQKAYLKRIINEFKTEKKEIFDEIINFKKELFNGTETNGSLKSKFEHFENSIRTKHEALIELYDQIFNSEEGIENIEASLKSYKSDFENKLGEIDDIYDEVFDYKNKLLGFEKENGEREKGIADQIKDQNKEFHKLYINTEKKHEELFNKIEGLLKGASTVALAKSFNEHKDSYKTINKIWLGIFICAIILMMGISIWGFRQSNYDLSNVWKYTLGNLPFIGGAIWMAIYASKQRSQNKRLMEEYAYKEDVAKIYYGLKSEIDELGDTDIGKELSKKVLEVIVDVVSINPSTTLEHNSHNEKGPLLEVLNKLTEKVGDKIDLT